SGRGCVSPLTPPRFFLTARYPKWDKTAGIQLNVSLARAPVGCLNGEWGAARREHQLPQRPMASAQCGWLGSFRSTAGAPTGTEFAQARQLGNARRARGVTRAEV